ncbi:hypothetical protein C8F04DRAFT_1178235 [Mycena alexandri]|uniref:Uncharacterized protein n=1 Tax=Mycena alexandri TaxID=1745969 RepID=A0AAD6T762_9AGAR|nr:hypothetical protein C8F04DRAFT_1178235 [Mycena alexandri]
MFLIGTARGYTSSSSSSSSHIILDTIESSFSFKFNRTPIQLQPTLQWLGFTYCIFSSAQVVHPARRLTYSHVEERFGAERLAGADRLHTKNVGETNVPGPHCLPPSAITLLDEACQGRTGVVGSASPDVHVVTSLLMAGTIMLWNREGVARARRRRAGDIGDPLGGREEEDKTFHREETSGEREIESATRRGIAAKKKKAVKWAWEIKNRFCQERAVRADPLGGREEEDKTFHREETSGEREIESATRRGIAAKKKKP